MRTFRALGPITAGLLVFTSVTPVIAGEDGEDTIASGGLEVEVDPNIVMLGDEVEVEVSFERERGEDDDEVDEDEADDNDEADDEADDAVEGDDEDDFLPSAELSTSLPTSVSFSVDLGDGAGPQPLPVAEQEGDDEEFEAEAEGTYLYTAVGDYTLTVTATPDVGEPVSVSLPVSVTLDPVAYPRDTSEACPQGLTVPARFVDVIPGSPHTAMIECLATRGLVHGRSSDAFNPSGVVSRAQMASFLVRLLEDAGVELPEDAEDAFDDDDGNAHEEAINQLAAAGLLSGSTDGEVRPNSELTREQMASLLVRALQDSAGLTLHSDLDYFADDDGSVHEAAINLAAASGIASGRAVLEYAPDAHLTRGQLATFLARTLDLLLTEPSPAA